MPDKRVALVTGSSSGIGAEVARSLAADGLRVVINSSTSVAAGEALAAAVVHFGRLDVLVNNAGRTVAVPHADLAAATPQVWRDILALNVIGTWQTTAAAAPVLRESGAGCVVNISSIAGSRPAGSSIPYAVSKAAIEHMTRLLAKTLGPEIRVNAVAPGLVETPWVSGSDFFVPIAEQVRALAPLRRVGLPADVAGAVQALVNATYTTGQVLLVDGGVHLVA